MFTKKIKLVAAIAAALTSIGLVSCTNTYHHESTGQFIDSAAITTKVKANLLSDKSIKSLPITVKTYKHTVQLSGFVENNYQKQRAVAIAQNVAGVENVQDSLVIKTH